MIAALVPQLPGPVSLLSRHNRCLAAVRVSTSAKNIEQINSENYDLVR